jgi:hypothetical protein
MRRKRRAALQAERDELQRVADPPLDHYDGAEFDRDHRVGARLVDGTGRVLVTRTEPPSRSLWPAQISLWPDGPRR